MLAPNLTVAGDGLCGPRQDNRPAFSIGREKSGGPDNEVSLWQTAWTSRPSPSASATLTSPCNGIYSKELEQTYRQQP